MGKRVHAVLLAVPRLPWNLVLHWAIAPQMSWLASCSFFLPHPSPGLIIEIQLLVFYERCGLVICGLISLPGIVEASASFHAPADSRVFAWCLERQALFNTSLGKTEGKGEMYSVQCL